MISEKIFKVPKISFCGTKMEKVRTRRKVEFIEKYDDNKITIQQSKLPSHGLHKSFKNYDSYTFGQIEVLMDKPFYLGPAVLELSKLLMGKTQYDNLKPSFGEKNTMSINL